MISIEKAQENLFENSTRDEMVSYAKDLGIKVHPATKTENIRKALCKHLGLVVSADSPVAPILAAIKPKSEIFPPYNLSPVGVWGGRMWRVKVGKPKDAAPRDKGTHLGWNGKEWGIKYGEVNVIPEPFLNRLREIGQKSHKSVVSDDGLEQRTEWEFEEKYPHNVIEIEEATKDRCGSLQEWYQKQGPKWFKARTVRELQMIAERMDVQTRYTSNDNRKGELISEDDLRGRLMVFLYGYHEVEEQVAA